MYGNIEMIIVYRNQNVEYDITLILFAILNHVLDRRLMYFINRSYKLDEKTRASIIEVDFPQYSYNVMEMELRHDDVCR